MFLFLTLFSLRTKGQGRLCKNDSLGAYTPDTSSPLGSPFLLSPFQAEPLCPLTDPDVSVVHLCVPPGLVSL